MVLDGEEAQGRSVEDGVSLAVAASSEDLNLKFLGDSPAWP